MYAELFGLPKDCRFETMIPKNHFEKKFKLTVAENRLLRTPYLPVKINLIGSLRTSLSFIPAMKTETMDYEDILFIEIQLLADHFEEKSEAVLRLFQKYIPKPVVILLYCDASLVFNTAIKKYDKSDTKKRSVKEMMTSPVLSLSQSEEYEEAFFREIKYDSVNKQNLKTTYSSYSNAVAALNRAIITHQFIPTQKGEEVHRINQGIILAEKEMETLRNKIRKSKDIRDQVKYKLILKEKKEQYKNLMQKWTHEKD